ncbi:MAG: HNH endonuclease [Acidobacteriota bacterium]
MEIALRELVRSRARDQCEYCGLEQRHSRLTFHIEHIIAKQHGGGETEHNLALACHRCNLHKGPNLSGIDPETGTLVPLFHPRRDLWSQHLELRNFQIHGITPMGRATVQVLAMNDARRVELRMALELR